MDYQFLAATGLYALAAILITYHQLRESSHHSIVVWWLVAVGWVVQCIPILKQMVAFGGVIPVNLAASLEWSALVMGLFYLVGWRLRRQEARSAAVLLLPLMTMTLGASLFISSSAPEVRTVTAPLLIAHLVLSLLAYGLFSIAAVFAMMDALQEHALKSKHLGVLFNVLPPLNALETTLFFMVRMGFALLTLSILSGTLYSFQQSGVYFSLTHKVVFTWATWLVFGTLLVGRHFQGWRGLRAYRFTLWGYLMLALAFLGVKFVKEILLHIN
ncbi:MAG: cytochrome c biogenesis protein CcsA [Magnetococcales bacterium]|nr:cytochrome c biogenesis protein CcsA [Magnetococcales bacterium]